MKNVLDSLAKFFMGEDYVAEATENDTESQASETGDDTGRIKRKREPKEARESRKTRTQTFGRATEPEDEHSPRFTSNSSQSSSTYSSSKTSDYDSARSKSKLVNMNMSNQNMIITPIKEYSDCKEIVKLLRERKSVIINVDQMDKNNAKRAVDFLSGAITAIDGDIKKISNSIVVVAPSNMKLTGMFGEEIPSNINDTTF